MQAEVGAGAVLEVHDVAEHTGSPGCRGELSERRLTHNPDHRTSPLLVLTENGRRVLQAITERAIVVNNRLADAVDPAALQATRDSLRRMIVALKAERP